jgi:hypothetical protein
MGQIKKLLYLSLGAIGTIALVILISQFTFITSPNMGLMGNIEQFSMTQAQFVEGAPSGDMIRVTIINTGVSSVRITEATIYPSQQPSKLVKAINIAIMQAFEIPKGYTLEIPLLFPSGTLENGTQYEVKVLTAKGTACIFSDPLIYNSANASRYDPIKDQAAPTPIENPPGPFWTPSRTTIALGSLVTALFAVPIACKIAHYVVRPQNRREFFVLTFFVAVIVVALIVVLVNTIYFYSQPIGLMTIYVVPTYF